MGFKSARESKGLTQAEVAQAVDVERTTVCMWETGKSKPRAGTLAKLAELFGCTMDELLAG